MRQYFLLTVLVCSHLGASLAGQTPELSKVNDVHLTSENDKIALDQQSTKDVNKRPFDSIAANSAFNSFGKKNDFNEGAEPAPREQPAPVEQDSVAVEPGEILPVPVTFWIPEGSSDEAENQIPANEDSNALDYSDNTDSENVLKRPFDRIGSSSFTSYGKRPFDRIGSSSFTSYGKRPFDRIGSSSFTSYGKRPFDRIGTSSFTSFGKRPFDRIGSSSFTSFGKRPFDRIGSSSFTSYGKRPFDRIGTSSFTSFGKRPFDRIGSSSFTSYGKRPFDRIGSSSFTSYGKRENEVSEIDDLNSPTVAENVEKGDEKIKMDPISTKSQPEKSEKSKSGEYSDHAIMENNVSGRKRREVAPDVNTRKEKVVKREALKRKEGELTLSLLGSHGGSGSHVAKRQSGMNGNADDAWLDDSVELTDDGLEDDHDIDELTSEKRRFDPISRSSSFSPFGKRRFDRISGVTNFSPFGKRRLDRISSYSGFGKFGKRRFDSISGGSRFSSFGKRSFDRISSGFSPFGKRRFDRLDRASSFSRFGKRNSFDDESLDLGKRRFDRIDRNSAFRYFGKRNADLDLARALESVNNDLHWLKENGNNFSKSPRVLIDSPWSERRLDGPGERLETLRLLETPTWLSLQDSNGVDKE